ncbi:MAG: alpha/beta hydrolase [Pseudomonadota bacterium]
MNAMTDIITENETGHFVQTPLGRVHVAERGGGEQTIVLWPSIFKDHRIYDALTDTLGDCYRFLLIDGPAHGLSDGPQEEFSMKECGDVILKVLDYFKLEEAVIGGTSWGGLAAAEAALTAPERIKSLILMNTPMEIDGASPSLSARMIAMGARWSGRRKFFQNGVAKSFFSEGALQTNAKYKHHFHDMLTLADPKKLATAVRSVILRGTPLIRRMADLAIPVLVIAGKDDEMYPIKVQAKAALRAPKGHFAPVDGKHISVVECPQTVASLMKQFLNQDTPQ